MRTNNLKTSGAAVSAFWVGLMFVSEALGQVPPPPGPAAPPPAAAPPVASDPFAGSNPDVEPGAPPPPPPAAAPPPPAAAPPAAEPAAAEPAPAEPAAATATATAGAGAGATPAAAGAAADVPLSTTEREQQERLEQRKIQPGLDGSSAIFRTQHAGSGPAGTFRFGLLTSYFTDIAFLCPQCSDSEGGPGSTPDHVQRVGAYLALSATPADFIEAYMAVRSTATSNTRGAPELLQVLGDSTWGVKAFMPQEVDKTFTAGGAAELVLLNGSGGVGIENASFALRALTSLDLNNRSDRAARFPLRFNFNLSYFFDNSGKLVEGIEAERGRGISRIERYGLNINRLDHFSPALGFEGTFEAVRPYLEWSIDVPANRQGYRCAPAQVYASDVCLEKHITFQSAPSRLTLGARAYLFLDGLAFHGALDIGTGGTIPPFWEEMQPETPWTLYFGASYAADTEPVIQVHTLPAPPAPPAAKPFATINGQVVEAGTQTGIANAIVRYQGRPLTGMVSDATGRFVSGPLDPGTYAFSVSAPDYEDGACSAEVTLAPPPAATPTPSPVAGTPPAAAPNAAAPNAAAAPAPTAPGEPTVVALRCELKAKPQLGSALVYAVDESQAGLPYAKITAIDSLGRPLSLEADDQGAVAFTNVVPGQLTVVVEAEGRMRATGTLEIAAKQEARSQITAFKRPKRPSFNLTAKELQLKQAIEFLPGTAQLTPESGAVVDELADFLRGKTEVGPLEIQAHTDNSTPPEQNLPLSTQRANVVRDLLIRNGVAATRLLAKGYGDTTPKAPNTSEQNRRRNNRIAVIVAEGTVLPQ